MSTAASLPPGPPLFPLPIHRLSVAQYHRMIQSGVLTENDRVELLEGVLVSKMPHNPQHDGTISVILRKLWTKPPSSWIVRIQSAITLEDSEPEPDLTIVKGPEERYLSAHSVASEIGQVIEVSDSSLENDRTLKKLLYARARIPIYWIVNLLEKKIEVYTEPRAGKLPTYKGRDDYGMEDNVPLLIAGKEIATFPVRELLS
jgi:hypothetical protein